MESTPLPPNGSPPILTAEISKDEKNLAMLAHLLAFAGLIVPFGNVIGPLVLWLMKKDTMPYVEYHAKEALNFNITVSIAIFACILTIWLFLPFLLAVAIGIAAVVFTIIAAIKASEGARYAYPLTLRLVK